MNELNNHEIINKFIYDNLSLGVLPENLYSYLVSMKIDAQYILLTINKSIEYINLEKTIKNFNFSLKNLLDLYDAKIIEIFDQLIYQESSNILFDSFLESFYHWKDKGASLGFAYAKDKDTRLKIILKVKDEVELIDKWIEHHVEIVGYENIIILDCGSTDFHFIEKLEKYRKDIIILNYPLYYDAIHNTNLNNEFYSLIASRSKYITILDADEYLYGYKEGIFSKLNVKKILDENQLSIIGGTWISLSGELSLSNENLIDFMKPMYLYNTTYESIRYGSINGKAIVQSDKVIEIQNLGHNLHVDAAIKLFQAESFGKLFIFHIDKLPPEIVRKRTLKHLKAKFTVPIEMEDETIIKNHLNSIIKDSNNKKLSESENKYINMYINTFEECKEIIDKEEEVYIVNERISFIKSERLDKIIKDFDFENLVSKYKN